ncbi:hypothetical protein GF336_05570 [Candidatus Woesearchaeota archaeon]|nr:hypothetical protein [Candidatus Woesearchaeota archaeon]
MTDWSMIFWRKWAETGSIILILIGFLVSISIQNPWLSYLVILCAGFMVGRLWFNKAGKQPLFVFFLIIVGFLLGYMMGAFNTDRKIVFIIFITSWIVSYKLHKEGYFP